MSQMTLDALEPPTSPAQAPKLVLGPLHTLERALAEEIAARKASDPLAPIALLIGGTLLRPYLQRRLALLLGGHINLHFLTPAELAVRLGEPAMIAAGRRPLPPLATRVLVGEVAREARGYFAPVAHTPGFADSLHRLFRELAQGGLDPMGFRAAAPAAGNNRRKYADLVDLYERYAERRRSHYGPDDCLAAADPARLGADALLVYGLWDPPAALRTAIEGIVTAGTPLTAFLPVAGSATSDGGHEGMRRWLAGLGAETVTAAGRPARPTALTHLQERLFLDGGESASTTEEDCSLRLLSAADPAREVRAAARACIEWAAEGIPFHDMAIAYRQAEQYRPLVESTFREAGIPVYLDEGTPISERPLGRRALALLDLVGSGLERRAVMDFLTDADLPEATRRRYGGIPAPRWDALSRRAGVVRGGEEWRDRLAALRVREEERYTQGEDPPPEWLPDRLATIERLERFTADLARALGGAPRSAPFSGHLDYLRGLFGTYLHGAEPILDALSPLAALDALARPIDFARFREIVSGSIDRLRSEELLDARSGLFGRRGVNVLDVNTLRHMRFACVAVLGLNERSFPPPPRQDALLLDEERQSLNEGAGTGLPLRVRGADPEPLGFAVAVQGAADRALLAYARTESGEGRAQLPSSFFRAAAEAIVGVPVPAEKIEALARDLPAFVREPAGRIGASRPADALTEDEYDRTLLEDDGALGAAVLAASSDFSRARAAHRARLETNLLTPYDGALAGAAAEALESHPSLTGPMSPSSLETYALCPLKFFLGRVLGLKAVEEPEEIESIDPMNRGALVHRVLERFLEELDGAGTPPAESRRAEQLVRLEEIGHEECEEAESRGITGYPLLWRYERQAILDDLRAWYEQELADPDAGRYEHGAYEVRFGPSRHGPDASPLSSDEPLRIETGGRELLVQGRMDRVDYSERTGAYRVVDYKTGSVKSEHRNGRLAGGRALQLPLYLLAGAERTGSVPARGEAQYFFASRYGNFRRVTFTNEDYEARREELGRILSSFSEGMRTGNFHARPGDHCKWCDFNSLCDARRFSILDRKREDPRVREMDEIGEIP